MSTKIYNGYRIKAKNFEEVWSMLNGKREDILALYNQKIIKEKLNVCLRILFINLLNKNPTQQLDVSALHLAHPDEKDPETEKVEPLEILIYPQKIRGHFLCNIWSNDNIAQSIQTWCPQIESYGYWDNTDRPDEITARAWRQRRDDWKKAVPGYSFNVCGLKMEFLVDYLIPSLNFIYKDEIIKTLNTLGLPHIQQCIDYYKRDYIADAIIKQEGLTFNYSNIIDIHTKLKEQCLTQSQQAIFEKEIKHLNSLLPKAEMINFDFLQKNLQQIKQEIEINYQKEKLNQDLQNNVASDVKIKKL